MSGQRSYTPELGRWLSRDPAGEKSSVNLHSFVENIPSCAWDLLGLLSSEQQCEFAKKYSIITDKKIKCLWQKIKESDCGEPDIECVCCEEKDAPCGEHIGGGAINICYNVAGCGDFIDTLVHELSHAYDECVRKEDADDCENRACTEIRASVTESACAGKTGNAYSTCILNLVWKATKKYREENPDCDMYEAFKNKWDKCSKSNVPDDCSGVFK